jgi:hypothetical protein
VDDVYKEALRTLRYVDDRDPEALAIFQDRNKRNYGHHTLARGGVAKIKSTAPLAVPSGALSSKAHHVSHSVACTDNT